MRQNKTGKVYLVGAGPGDDGLITVKGRQLIHEADVIFYDYLVNQSLLDMATLNCEKIYVGKKGGYQNQIFQSEIQEQIIHQANLGKNVVRLKGGDPFIFGRGGEEAQSLKQAGVPFEIVPGISSPLGVPAYAGIPLTHRDFASEVVFVTGHENNEVNWKAVAEMGTIVILMGYKEIGNTVKKILQNGKDPKTPAAIISWGTTNRQKKNVTVLENLAKKSSVAKMGPPSIIIIGKVVSLSCELDWFESRPLFGQRIIVTTNQSFQSRLSQKLQDLGANISPFPTIRIVPPDDYSPLDQALKNIFNYQWLLFTSVNAVYSFWNRFQMARMDFRDLAHLHIGVIGPATAEKLKLLGFWIDVMPKEYNAESFLANLTQSNIEGSKVLIPRAKEAREVLVDGLEKLKCQVSVVEAYQNVLPEYSDEQIHHIFNDKKPQWIVFASSSAVTNFFEIVGDRFEEILSDVKIACLGPITKSTLEEKGVNVDVVPAEATIDALVETMVTVG